MTALPDSDPVSGMPFTFEMAMGVRHRDKELKAQLDSALVRRHDAIVRILQEYNVPLLAPRVGVAPAPGGDTVRDSLLVPDSIYQGWKWFHVYCFRCHGEDAIGGVNPAAPDLRWALNSTGGSLPRDSFVTTALNGRPAKGMPAWKQMLDTSAIQELYQYVKARSDGWLKPGRPHRPSDLTPKTP
jgi:mono/diheme cytochrome c family protein